MGLFGDGDDEGEFFEDLLLTGGNVGSALELEGLRDGDVGEVLEGEMLGGSLLGGGRRRSGLSGLGLFLAAEELGDRDDRDRDQRDPFDQRDNRSDGAQSGW